MALPEGLVEIEPLTNTVDGVVEIFRDPVSDLGGQSSDFFDLVEEDVDGSGLILFVFKGKRNWIKTSVSKTPFSFTKKALASMTSPHFAQVLVIRGSDGYPLSDKEIKNISGLLNNRLKDTPTHLITSYITVNPDTVEAEIIADNVVDDIIEILSHTLGLDVARPAFVDNQAVIPAAELQSGTDSTVMNGLTVTLQTKLVDDDEPEEGLEYTSIRVVTADGKTVVFASTGSGNTVNE